MKINLGSEFCVESVRSGHIVNLWSASEAPHMQANNNSKCVSSSPQACIQKMAFTEYYRVPTDVEGEKDEAGNNTSK